MEFKSQICTTREQSKIARFGAKAGNGRYGVPLHKE